MTLFIGVITLLAFEILKIYLFYFGDGQDKVNNTVKPV